MIELHEFSTPRNPACIDDLIAEATILFPEFLREGEVLPEAELARQKSYKRFLRIGISIWSEGGEPSVRQAMVAIARCSGAGCEEASEHLEYLWNGISAGCLAPAKQGTLATAVP
jgi:hypothetical protein